MKTNKFILAGLMAVGCFFAACTEEAPEYVPAQPETNEIQAYIYSTTPIYVQLTELGGKFPVVIGRNTTNATSFEVMHDDTLGLFTVEAEVNFAEGQKADTLWIQANYNYGETNTITLNIPEEYTTAYGSKTTTIDVLVDYTWVPMGTVMFQSEWEGAEAEIAIEQAKEYNDDAGKMLFRLVSPYYYLAPAYCTVPGLHLQFLLDKDYNAVDLHGGPLIQVENTGYNWIYWDLENFGAYETFINQGNTYIVVALWNDGTNSLYGPAKEMWQWIEGYPGELPEIEEEEEPTQPAE